MTRGVRTYGNVAFLHLYKINGRPVVVIPFSQMLGAQLDVENEMVTVKYQISKFRYEEKVKR